MRRTGHLPHMEEERNGYKILVGKLEEKILLARPRHRWNYNIEMDLRETGCDKLDCPKIGTSGGLFTVMNQVP